MKPPLSYFGGKTRLAPWIVSLMPPHRVYIEPFAGSAAVLFAKSPSQHELLNDVDGNLVNFFRVLRERPEDLARVCSLTPYARAEFEAADLTVGTVDELERARRYWIRSAMAFNSGGGLRGWSVSLDQSTARPQTCRSQIARFMAAAERLATVFIENRDALEVIDRYGRPDGLIYADPPYFEVTRSAINRSPGAPGDYHHEFSTEDHHRRLAEVLRASPAHVLLSGRPCPLYDELYDDDDGWWRVDRDMHQHASNGRGATSRAVESVWSNRPLAGQGSLLTGAAS